MFHITVAIARFFEMLLLDIFRSVAGLLVAGIVIMAGGIGIRIWLKRR